MKAGANEKIIERGEYGRYFYVLIKGVVAVIIQNPKNNRLAKDQIELAELSDGATFGDLALLQKNSVRSATIITKTKCEFALMDRESFWKFSGKQKKEELDFKISQLQKIPFLKNWNLLDLKTICFDFKPQKYFRGETIYLQGRQNNGIYFIVDGEVTLQTSFKWQKYDKHEIFQEKDSEQMFPVTLLGSGQIFGIEPGQNYMLTAICASSSVLLYLINRNQLEKRLQSNKKSLEVYTNIQNNYNLLKTEKIENICEKQQYIHEKQENKLLSTRFLPSQSPKQNLQFVRLRDVRPKFFPQIPKIEINQPKKRNDSVVTGGKWEKHFAEAKKLVRIRKGLGKKKSLNTGSYFNRLDQIFSDIKDQNNLNVSQLPDIHHYQSLERGQINIKSCSIYSTSTERNFFDHFTKKKKVFSSMTDTNISPRISCYESFDTLSSIKQYKNSDRRFFQKTQSVLMNKIIN